MSKAEHMGLGPYDAVPVLSVAASANNRPLSSTPCPRGRDYGSRVYGMVVVVVIQDGGHTRTPGGGWVTPRVTPTQGSVSSVSWRSGS